MASRSTVRRYTNRVAPSPSPSLPPQVASALSRGAWVVAANSRAARVLRMRYAEAQKARDLTHWQEPSILDWQGLLHALWSRSDDERLVLSPLQETALWAAVQEQEAAFVVAPERLAALGADAYALLSEYRAHPERRSPWFGAHEDAEHFQHWAERFDAACQERHALPAAELSAVLAANSEALFSTSSAPEIFLIGFDRLTPARSHLLDSLERAGAAITFEDAGDDARSVTIVTTSDEQEEMLACAHWLRARLLVNPAQRIGVLTPQLDALQPQLDRTLRRVLMPQTAMQPGGGAMPFEFSTGVSLGSVPIVQAALLLLRWLLSSVEAAEASLLLTSGWVAGSSQESLALATLDARLRELRLLPPRFALSTLLRLAAEKSNLIPAGFASRLQSAEIHLRTASRTAQHPPAYWAELFAELLELCGWPGHRALSSVEYQARESWKRLLDEAARLGYDGARMDAHSFFEALRDGAHSTSFAPESTGAPIAILSVSEAAGQRFDAIWFLRADENTWPRRGRPHPLLPEAMQATHTMPHGSVNADRELAEEQTARILRSTPELVVSTPSKIDGNETRPSPLLLPLLKNAIHLVADTFIPAPVPPSPVPLVAQIEDARVHPWPLARNAGGVDVLKRQAACGFQSFAAKRLRARSLDAEAWGLDAGERGSLLHAVLAELWSPEPTDGLTQLHTGEDLRRARSAGRLQALVEAAIERASAAAMRSARGDTWQTSYLQTEAERLCRRILDWLEIEATRADFSIAAIERKLDDAHIGPLQLNLRADRIDSTAGGLLVLDYKTSAGLGPQSWEGDRPDEPQLPIYALYGGYEEVCGVAFARIRPRQTALLARTENPEEQLGKPWARDKNILDEAACERWAHALQSLAAQFAEGEAPVNPKRGDQTCRLCDLMSLCRVRSAASAPFVEDEEDDA